MNPLNAIVIDPATTLDIAPDVIDGRGLPRVLPAAYWDTTTLQERAWVGMRHGIYSFPTVELVEHLRDVIGGRSAIEIGAGNGVLAEALGIPATDSRHQDDPATAAYYSLLGAATVPYGPNIIEAHASRAVRRFKPQVVIDCWVTHKYDPARHWAGGNEIGVDEEDILRNCEQYVFVGNDRVHMEKKIWDRRKSFERLPFVYSRGVHDLDFVAVWRGSKK